MKKRLLLFGTLLMTVLLSLGSITAFAEEQSEDDDVYVSVYTDKTDYQVGDSITVVAEVTNRGTANISELRLSFALPVGITINTGKPDVSDITVAGGSVFRKTVFATIESAPAETETETETTDEPTDEKDGVPVWVWIVGGAVLLVAAVGAAVFLVLKKKKAAKALCLLLGFVMALNVFAGPAMADEDTTAETTASEAETETQPEPTAPEKAPDTILTAEAAITVDGKSYIIKVTLTVPGAASDGLSDFASDEIYFVSGKENTVTFTVKASAGRNDIQLIKGENEVVGIMHDDGLEGDEVAMDNIYSYRISFVLPSNESLDETYHSQLDEQTSESVTLYSFSDEVLDKADKKRDEVVAHLRELESSFSNEGTDAEKEAEASALFNQILSYVEELQNNGDIMFYRQNGLNLMLRFESGYLAYEFNLSSEPTMGVPRFISSIQAQGAPRLTHKAYEGSSARVLSAEPLTFDLTNTTDQSADIIVNNVRNYVKHEKNDQDVNILLMKNLSDYKVVLFSSHGGYDPVIGSDIMTGEPVLDERYYEDTVSEHPALLTHYTYDENAPYCYYCITAYFFDKYYSEGELDRTVFFLDTCHSGDDSTLADTLLKLGASCVFGYENSVYVSYASKMLVSVFEAMSRNNGTVTAGDALEEAKRINGYEDPQDWWERFKKKMTNVNTAAELVLFGDRNTTLSSVSQNGTLSGKVCNASNRVMPIPGAVITVYPMNGDQPNRVSAKVATANASGNYYLNLPAGEYQLSIRAAGYVPFAGRFTVAPNQNTYVETFLLVEGEADPTTGTVISTGIAKGRIFNALTGRGLGDATLTIYNDWGSIRDNTPVTIIQTDGSGYYSVELPFGYYTVHLSKEDFNDDEFNIVVQAGTTDEQNGTISPVIEGDGYLITLTWGENPRDVDSHMVGTYSDGNTQFHVYFHDKEKYDGEIPVCILDYDDTSSYGPEHITLIPTSTEPYYYYLHRFAGSGTLASSEALVTVIQNNRIIASYNVPTDRGSGDYWNIFAIKNGRIITRNTITSSPELNYAD